MDDVAARVARIRQEDGLLPDMPIPADRALSSASGLDPHISLKNARLQAPRIAKVRDIPVADLEKMILDHADPDFLGIWGHRGVNVIRLNMALDMKGKK
jgi:K+-transporting ATPase ATPase C chain